MKQIIELIDRYQEKDVHLYLENDELLYNSPKNALTREMISELSMHKKDIIKYFISKQSSKMAAVSITPLEERNELPLSFSQEQLWFLNQAESIQSTYNMMSVFRLKGTLHISSLHTSFNEILHRHEILRSTYQVNNGIPFITIRKDLSVTLQLKDFTSLDDQEKLEKARHWVNEETQTPFDLQKGPLFRLSLVVLGPDDHLLVLTIHHIISDGWSMGVLFKEWEQLYNASVEGTIPELQELSIQYSDYAAYQRDCYRQGNFRSALDYWKRKLDGAPRFLELPADNIRPSIQTFRGNTERIPISKEITEQLKFLSKQYGMTLYMILLSLYGFLLSRYSGQEDIILGAPLSGRNHEQINNVIGFFVNTLPLRFNYSEVSTFNDLFLMVKKEVIEAFSNQELPFEILIDHLKPERNRSYSPLVQVLFVLQNTSQVNPAFAGLNAGEWRADIRTSKLDLTLMMTETDDGLLGEWEYNSDLFKPETIRQFAKNFERVCKSSLLNPRQFLRDVSLLSDEEYKKIVIDWNHTKTDYPSDCTVHQLFEEQVQKKPCAIALIYGDEVMTYDELNQKAENLKLKLLSLGLKQEEPIGICLERSFNLIISLLAILKAGGVYVPLDAGYPDARIKYMLDDANINILLTEKKYLEIIPGGLEHVICPDEPWDIKESADSCNGCEVTAAGSAYIIYTSGSTGKPKGAIIPHRAIVRLVNNTNYVTISQEDVFFQAAPVSFDAATFEIWGALLNGAQLVLPPPHKLTLKEIGQALKKYNVSILWLTAGLFHLMVDSRLEDLRGVKQLLAGGEVLSVPHVKKVLRELDSTVLINGYGPTENTTFSCCYRMTHVDQIGNTVSIGKPIANSRAYILDKYLQPMPVGVAGELYLGGDGLAIEYLNRPDLTHERFITSPFAHDGNERLYRTGDLARFLPDGNIEFLGRIDSQVKIRGFRIETGEIESVISSFPGVSDTVILCKDDLPGGKGLVAYIVPDEEAKNSFSPDRLCDYVKKWLPEYMYPSCYVVLEKFPLNPNGKIDRKALPAPEMINTGSQAVKPSFVEKGLIQLAKKILNNDSIQRDNNFFEMGGNSLAIIRLISEIENTFGVSLSIGDFMELPSISELAVKIEREMDNNKADIENVDVEQVDDERLFIREVEDKLIHISEKLLNTTGITPDDNFFEKGGNSLAIIRFIAELEEAFGISLSIGDFIELPTLKGLAAKIRNTISGNKKESSTENPSITSIRETGLEFPLSPVQKQLWFLEQLEGIGTTYNISSALKLTGALNVAAMEKSILMIVERHEILRTTFFNKNGNPVQTIHPPQLCYMITMDLKSCTKKEQQNRLDKIIQKETRWKFDLKDNPLFRFIVVQLNELENIIIFTIHHIIFDGWSMGVFFHELSRLYLKYGTKASFELDHLPMQYKNFTNIQYDFFRSSEFNSHIEYWQKKLKGSPPFLPLPLDKPRPRNQTFHGKTVIFDIPDSIRHGLNTLNKNAESMLFMTLFAAYGVLLARWCRADDMVIGTPVANRNKNELESLMGYFVNILPVRAVIDDDMSFKDIIKQLKATILEAYDHQAVPFETIVEKLRPQRDPAYSPLFQIMFHLYTPGSESLNFPDIEVEEIEIVNPTAKFDLILSITERAGGLIGDWEFNTDLFDDDTIDKLSGHFLILLEQVIENPEIKVSQINFGTVFKKPAEMNKLNSIGSSDKDKNSSTGPLEMAVTKTELELIEIFEKLFNKNHLTKAADFFKLGGHSLLIVSLISDIEKNMDVELSVVDIMNHPMISNLAALIDSLPG